MFDDEGVRQYMFTKSRLFDELMMERCEEVIMKDEICRAATKEAMEASMAFFDSLSPEQQKAYIKFESIIERKNSRHLCAVYRQAFQDGKNGL
jgi:hypothetical protein